MGRVEIPEGDLAQCAAGLEQVSETIQQVAIGDILGTAVEALPGAQSPRSMRAVGRAVDSRVQSLSESLNGMSADVRLTDSEFQATDEQNSDRMGMIYPGVPQPW